MPERQSIPIAADVRRRSPLRPNAGTPPSRVGGYPALEALRQKLLAMDETAALAFFRPIKFDRLLKTTISLCADCLVHVPALVVTTEGKVWMHKQCERHGHSKSLLESDETFYHLSNKDYWGRRFTADKVVDFPVFNGGCGGELTQAKGGCLSRNRHETGDDSKRIEAHDTFGGPATETAALPYEFTDQIANKSCTILVEVTNACNLACPVCYSDANGDRKMPLAVFKGYILRLIKRKGTLDSVQLTGGEAVLHPEFWEMVAFLHTQDVKKIYLPTNGIAFAKTEVAERLAPFRDKLMVLLQFDGQQPNTNRAMRDADTTRIRDQVIENLNRLGVHMQLTMTITLGVNDHEVGWVVETGLRHPNIKVVALQPVTYSGRYDLPPDPLHRMTLSDCVKAVAAQVRQRSQTSDFKPIPCSHPNCGWITLFVQRFGITANISRHVDLEKVMNRVSNRTLLNSEELRSIVGTNQDQTNLVSRISLWAGRQLIRSTDVFAVAIKPFMDRFNYDQDRISACCHHLLDTRGNPISFCEYNARLRPSDSWNSFPLLKSAAHAAPKSNQVGRSVPAPAPIP